MSRRTLIVAGLSVLLMWAFAIPVSAGEEFEVPLEVFEARRLGADGMNRANEGVVIGVPFTDDMNVAEIDGRPALSLRGAERYQFRTLARWPSGNVRWAAVAFQTDCPAGESAAGFTVVRGRGVSDGPHLARDGDEPGTKVIQTGEFEFTARPERAGGVYMPRVTDLEGTRYFPDGTAEVVVEENGPVRAVIRTIGCHRDEEGNRMLGFQQRMIFWRGRSEVKTQYTLTNDEAEENPTRVTIASVELVGPEQPDRTRVRMTAVDGAVTPTAEAPVVYYQARPRGDFARGSGREQMSWQDLGVHPDDTGWWIRQGENELAAGDDRSVPDLMWVNAADGQGSGVLVGIRFARGNFPKSFRVDGDGRITVGLLPVENEIGHLVAHGSHRTFEVLHRFHDRPLDEPAGTMYRFQYPLTGRAPVAWYNRCIEQDEVYPMYHMVSRREEEALAEERGWQNRHAARARDMVVWRTWYWGRGGFRNQHDFARIALVNFLRDDNIDRAGAYFLYAENRFNYNADWSIHHGEGRTDFGRRNFIGRKIIFEEEHLHWYGLPLYYYTTGDQRVGDATVGYLHKFREDCSSPRMYGWTRFFGWAMYFLAGGYDMTGDERFRDGIRTHVRTVMSGERWPMDWNRGVFGRGGVDWTDQPEGEQVVDHAPRLMNGYIIHDSFWNARRQFEWDDPVGDRLEDICEGIQWYMAREQCMRTEDGRLFMPYRYNLNGEPLVLSTGYYTPGTSHFSLLLPRIVHGEELVADRIADLMQASYAHGLREDGFTFLDHPGGQAALYHLIHRQPEMPEAPVPAITDLRVEPLGDGRVRLSWTTPESEVPLERFQARYSKKEMVPNLNFDPVELVYEFSPETHANWWAAEHLFGEPEAAPGERQSFVADLNDGADYKREPFEPGEYRFALRAWDAANRRTAISNQVTVEVE